MMELTNIRDIRELLARHGFRFSKSMGQNFLCDAGVPRRIAAASGADGETGVLEIGPGIGCLTRELSQLSRKVVSVELDKSLEPVLGETLSGCENTQVVFGDIMKTDLNQLIEKTLPDCSRRIVCANLPYNITSPVLTALISSRCFDSITVMIQREVAHRICAQANTPDYGAFTVFVQWHCSVQQLFDVPPSCFIPAPKVTSTVIRLDRRTQPPCTVRDEAHMFRIVRAAFNQRRKTLSNALCNHPGLHCSKADAAAALQACALDGQVRGEALCIEQFAQLSDALQSNP